MIVRLRWCIVVLSAAVAWAQTAANSGTKLEYPKTRTIDQIDELHGEKIADPYRWLEDLDSPDTRAWVDAQNAVTESFLEQIATRAKIRERMTRLWDFERYGTPFKEGRRYFFSKNDGLQPQSVIYWTEKLSDEPRVLLNPNEWSKDGTIALAGLSVREDGKLAAYGMSTAGSDWVEYRVLDIDSGKLLDDHLKWIKFSGASWKKDGSGFFYSRYDEPQGDKLESVNYYQKLFYHEIGTPQSADRLVYHRPDEKEWGFGGSVSEDGRYLIITVSQGTERKNRVYFQDLAANDGKTVQMLDAFDAQYSFINNDGPVFYFFTDKDAPRGRVIAVDSTKPQPEYWKEIIPQAEETLQDVNLVGERFICTYLRDARSQVKIFDLTGKPLRELELPGLGTAGGFGGKRTDTETFYIYTSFNRPTTVYRYDIPSGKSEVFRQPKVDFDPDAYEVKQVFYKSKDGTRVPMFLTHKKGIKLDGTNPCLLYGYGGFNASMTPSFSIARVVWLEMGGVYALANLRGGGEYGKTWHDAGRLKNKQNVFDDFIAAAEWLIDNKYTTSKKLAIAGGSNGGLLVGACMNQRPDLFGACLPAVGVMDMLRFHKFTIGWAWTSDYGSPDDAEMFKVLKAYSPLHNLKVGTCYPPTLVTTADHDDRVVPAHSFKYISALQAAQGCDNPVLIRIETRAGHGGGKPTQKIIEEISDQYAFLTKVFGMEYAKK